MAGTMQLQTRSELPLLKRLAVSMKFHQLFFNGLSTLLLSAGAVFILFPFLYMVSTSLKDVTQLRTNPRGLIPEHQETVEIDGKDEPLYLVNIDGVERQMALIKNQPGGKGIFVDPANPSEQIILKIDEQKQVETLDVHLENYAEAWDSAPFNTYLVNTLLITFVGMFGMLLSCSLVAYGFSRFRARWINTLFLLLLSTIMLPRQVTLIPIYILFQKIGWVDTLLPLIVPQFFANAYDVFLLRQFFMRIPLELDDAARLDGANPLQVLWYVILPQARPALLTVGIFHFTYAWNDFYEPLIFLHSQKNWTLAIGLQTLDAMYTTPDTHHIMAISLLMMLPPIILFFLSQRIFTQGVVVSGVKG